MSAWNEIKKVLTAGMHPNTIAYHKQVNIASLVFLSIMTDLKEEKDEQAAYVDDTDVIAALDFKRSA